MGEDERLPTGGKYLPEDLITDLWDRTRAYVAGYVSQHPSSGTPGEIPDIATDDEVAEMLNDVFSPVVE